MIFGFERFWRFFICFFMDKIEINNWKLIVESMEVKGEIESWFYFCVCVIVDGKFDFMFNILELLVDFV